ncbi:glycosyltransferase [Muriicola soli]|uniref:Glycosyltransferase n=1 Tax=Muriicola soli TaxID=2507538 RepID=A0A411E8B2_9FLAO|nr:glycosyltransferase [Muriicola soli]QBA63888.1 glycosyltransferase [Muriicola soli]
MNKVTVVIPMYNVASYLKNCVNSVLDQNDLEDCVEVLMINDGSPDNSEQVAVDLAKNHPMITVISQKNKGLGGARNTGIEQAKGKYVIFLDADDKLMPNTLSSLISKMDNYSLDVLEFGARSIDEQGVILNTMATNSQGNIYPGIEYYQKIQYLGSACNKVYSKEFLMKHNLFFLEHIYGEDFEFNTRVLYYAKRVLAVDIIGSEFLHSSNSITRNSDMAKKDKYARDYIKILRNINSFYNKAVIQDNKSEHRFFRERLTLVNVNAFFLLFKNGYSYKKINDYRNKLNSEKLLFIEHHISNSKKNLFRVLFLKNFFLFRISQPIIALLKR